MKHSATLLLFIYLFCYTTNAQDKPDKEVAGKLDEILSNRFRKNEPGMSILIAKKGAVIYEKAFGSGSIELNVPMKPEMVFNLASVGKQFTAVAILQLVEQGRINLQDSIQKYLKNFPSKGSVITIENLLTHTSGIKDYLQIDFTSPNMERWSFTPKVLIDSFKNFPLDFEPGTRFSYSNSGYFLLGYIIEAVTGMSYPKYMQDYILSPLSLTNTYFDTENSIVPNRVAGYKKDNSRVEKADFWSSTITYAAGGLVSNVEDLYKWHQSLYEYKILKKETLAKAFTPFHLKDGSVTEYGYGWYMKTINGIKSVEHDGAMSGFLAREVYYPDQDIFIAALFNCGCAPKDELSVIIGAIVLGRPLQTDIKINESIIDGYAGTYQMVNDPKRTVIISKVKGQLFAKVSGQQTFQLIFSANTKFEFKGVLGAFCEFILENGKVTKFIASQNGVYEWKKIL